MDLPKRKNPPAVIRLFLPGAYFVTVCTHEKRCIFSDVAVGAIHESPLRSKGGRSLLSKMVGFLKMNSSKQIHLLFPELDVWQRSYREYVIRNEADYRQIWEYTDKNPAKWAEDR